MSKELRHDRHTVSLLADHMVISPKYRGKVLVGIVAMLAEAIIRKTCKEFDIKIIDMSVNPDHMHLFIKYSPKYSVSYISKMIKGRSSKVLRNQQFPVSYFVLIQHSEIIPPLVVDFSYDVANGSTQYYKMFTKK